MITQIPYSSSGKNNLGVSFGNFYTILSVTLELAIDLAFGIRLSIRFGVVQELVSFQHSFPQKSLT